MSTINRERMSKHGGYIVASAGSLATEERESFANYEDALAHIALLKAEIQECVTDAIPCDVYDIEKPDEVTVKQEGFFETAFIVKQPETVKEWLEFELRLARAAVDEDEVLDANGEYVNLALDRIAAIVSKMS